MPNYFSDYDTTVHFISEEEFDRDHTAMPHGGFVIRTGKTGKGENTDQLIEYILKAWIPTRNLPPAFWWLMQELLIAWLPRDRPAARPFSMWLRLTFPR